MQDLLHKLESYQGEVIYWQTAIARYHNRLAAMAPVQGGATAQKEAREERERIHFSRAFAIIVESYDEIDAALGQQVVTMLEALLTGLSPPQPKEAAMREAILQECSITAGALAADRATSPAPIAVAEVVFIGVFLINTLRLRTNEQGWLSGTPFVNIELHSIGFSALFFWLIPIVFTAALIGASRTQTAIPRILLRFRRDVMRIDRKFDVPSPNVSDVTLKRRWMNGMPVWIPGKPFLGGQFQFMIEVTREEQSKRRADIRRMRAPRRQVQLLQVQLLYTWPALYTSLPFLAFGCAIATGTLVSYFVAPRGWRCRTWGELIFALIWFVSYLLTCGISRMAHSSLWTPSTVWFEKSTWLPSGYGFYIMFAKDFSACGAVIAWVVVTQIGYYNRRDCYSTEALGLVLPEQSHGYEELQAGLRVGGSFLTILMVGITVQAAFIPGLIWVRYSGARNALLQSDKDVSALISARP